MSTNTGVVLMTLGFLAFAALIVWILGRRL